MTKMRFGLSCKVNGEEALGHILAQMKLRGAEEIGYELLTGEATSKQNGQLLLEGPTHYRRSPTGNRKTARQMIDEIVAAASAGEEVLMRDITARLSRAGRHGGITLMPWMARGLLEKVGTGVYRRTHRSMNAGGK
jgi:hypothetical protein